MSLEVSKQFIEYAIIQLPDPVMNGYRSRVDFT